MFAAMLLKAPPVSLKNKLFEFFSPTKPKGEIVRLKNGAFFYNITMPLKKGGINWDELREFSDTYSDKILMPCDIKPPEKCELKRLTPIKIIPKAVISTSAKLFSMRKIQFEEIAVIDKNGEMANEVRRLVPYCKMLCIITDNPSAYFDVSDRILDEFGAAILISDAPVLKGDDCAVIAPMGVFSYPLPHSATVITGHNVHRVPQPKHLRCATLNLEKEYIELLPEGIDINDFAGALYEFAAVKDDNNTFYKTMINYGREVLLEQITL